MTMRESAKPDAARAMSMEAHASNSAQRSGARFANTTPAANDMNGRVEVIRFLAPAYSGQTPPGRIDDEDVGQASSTSRTNA
jgi:hypothetical protein